MKRFRDWLGFDGWADMALGGLALAVVALGVLSVLWLVS